MTSRQSREERVSRKCRQVVQRARERRAQTRLHCAHGRGVDVSSGGDIYRDNFSGAVGVDTILRWVEE